MTTTLPLNSGAHIPQIGFGTSQAADAARSVAEAVRAGYRHIDTAQMYGNETGVGEGVRASGVPREEVFVTTKLNNGHHDPTDVHRTFQESLDRLGFDYVDLFLIHWPLPFLNTDYVDTWKAMLQVQETGRARSVGVSNFQPEHLERIIAATGVVPAVNQIEVHPYFANNELREFSKARGIMVEAWSPLGKGTELSDPVIAELAAKHGHAPAQVILRWHLQRGDVVIPKSDNPERIRSNLDLSGFELTEQDMAALDALDKGEEGRRSPHPNEFGK
ncbi:aldo/keto reductase [Nesterenkonia ebinurensis]|uniref:aldo/keto reductase n=1 Tax=Nesterenkonia ebinurensis TaxID=2608252 RepID=UPI00123DE7AE|nr:aldo/keto reductase [Nesterenkonia ebinurensis]